LAKATLHELMQAEFDELVGPKSKHDPDRTAVRHGHDRGDVTLGGRRMPVERLRPALPTVSMRLSSAPTRTSPRATGSTDIDAFVLLVQRGRLGNAGQDARMSRQAALAGAAFVSRYLAR
jgi:hypothetical protein